MFSEGIKHRKHNQIIIMHFFLGSGLIHVYETFPFGPTASEVALDFRSHVFRTPPSCLRPVRRSLHVGPSEIMRGSDGCQVG